MSSYVGMGANVAMYDELADNVCSTDDWSSFPAVPTPST